jgi:hypothetical protein
MKFDLLVYTFELADKIRQSDEQATSWWNISMAVVPCFNSQALPLHHSHTFTRRLLVIIVGAMVLLTTNYYQAFILNGMMIKNVPSPYTIDELAKKLYANEMTAVFSTRT